MNNDLDRGLLEKALILLGDLLDEDETLPVDLVVIGGSALLATGISNRATQDFDILARRGEVDREIMDARPLPDYLIRAAKLVSEEFQLPLNWLNAAAALFSIPFADYPEEVWSGGLEKSYGDRLHITYVGRKGLIYLKFHAAVDSQRQRRIIHRDDLAKLSPTEEESQRAIDWLIREELITSDFKLELTEVLELLNHGNLIPEIERRLS